MLTNKLDARQSISFGAKDVITSTLGRGKRQIVLLSIFVNCDSGRRGLSKVFSHTSRVDMGMSSVPRMTPSLTTMGTSEGSRSPYFFKPGMVHVYRVTSVIFVTLRKRGKRGKGLRTTFSLLNMGCAKDSCLDDTVTVGGNVTGRLFTDTKVPTPENVTVGGRGHRSSIAGLPLALPYIMGPYYKKSDVNIAVIESTTRFGGTLSRTFR